MLLQESGTRPTLYGGLAETIVSLIASGTFREGQRIPSIRTMSRQHGVSVNTVREAYWVLETQRILESRPQSGYFVKRRAPAVPTPSPASGLALGDPHEVLPCAIREEWPQALQERPYRGLDLVRATPDPGLLPTKRLNAFLGAVSREAGPATMDYDQRKGLPELREQIARISLEAGIRLAPDDFLVTGGCIAAIILAVEVLCRPGDTVALESPGYSEFFRLFKTKGIRVLEIPTSPEEGMSLEVLEWALDQHDIKAVLSIPTFNNPVGFSMPEARKRALVDLLTRRSVPLIEDDAYGDLSFLEKRPPACKAFDTAGMVIYCSSISKTVSPGYRVGWLAGGRWHDALVQQKSLSSMGTAVPTQMAVARFLAEGNFARHLRTLRRALADQTGALAAVVAETFPDGTRITRPLGGVFLWVELPEPIDTEALYPRAVAEGIFYRPGVVFSGSGKFLGSMRLGTGTWNPELERSVRRLGQLLHQCGELFTQA
jgi:DNA-binding transcriptional MocR family regulator